MCRAIYRFRNSNITLIAGGSKNCASFEKAVAELDVNNPAAPPRAMCLTNAPVPQPQRIFLRGNPDAQGAVVPAEFLSVLSGSNRKPFTQGSGRLELARAITSKTNPLTARVMVNRVWLEHFVNGIVPRQVILECVRIHPPIRNFWTGWRCNS